MMGVTFSGDVTFQGPMFDIHDNEHVHIGHPSDGRGMGAAENDVSQQQVSQHEGEELFHFIHPAVDGQHEWAIHEEIRRLVTRQGLQEICQYLLTLRNEKKVLLPQNIEVAYNELVRMGMPHGVGFSLKTFSKYYKR